MSRLPLLVLVASLAVPSLGFSENPEFVCTSGKSVRKVQIISEKPDAKVPCAVQYLKETEAPGQTTTLWKAQNDANYCWEKAKAFLEKLGNAGWKCAEAGAEAPAAAPAPAQ